MRTAPSAKRVGAVYAALLAPTFLALGAPSVALPSIARDLAQPFGATAWVLASWALTAAVAMPVFGRASHRMGLRWTVLVGVILVAGGSVLAAVAPALAVLILGRAVGGAGAGALVVASYAIVAERLDGVGRAQALAIVATVGATTSGCGTLVGGLLSAWPGWRSVIALPALVLLVLLPALRLAPSARVRDEQLDLPGAALLTVAAAAVVLLLQAPSTQLPIVVVIALGGAAVLCCTGLVRHVRRSPDGFVPLRIIRTPGFVAAGVVGLGVFAAYYGAVFAVPTLVGRATHWGTAAVGAALLPCALFSVLGSRSATRQQGRWSTAVVAVLLSAASLAGLLVAATLPMLAVVAIVGLALSTAAFAGAQAVLFGLPPRLVSRGDEESAQGLFAFLVYGGSSTGPAMVGGLSAALPLGTALGVSAVLPLIGLGAALLLRRSDVR